MLWLFMLEKTVGVFRGKEAAILRRHLSSHVIEDAAGDVFEFRFARDLESVEICDRELRLVVEHFFEMWHVPQGIDRVAMEATSEMIVNSARRHFAQRVQIHRQRLVTFGRLVAIAREDAEKKIQRRRSRKFWGITESAFTCIIDARQLLKTPR
jgi:hypothetical protein